MKRDYIDYIHQIAKDPRVVDLTTGNIMQLSANSYDPYGAPLNATYLDNDGYYLSETITEENYSRFPLVIDYVRMPENKAIFQLVLEELDGLRNYLRKI